MLWLTHHVVADTYACTGVGRNYWHRVRTQVACKPADDAYGIDVGYSLPCCALL